MKSKKGEMSIKVVIGLAIALIVFVILVTLISQRVGLFKRGTSCEGQGGKIINKDDDCDGVKMITTDAGGTEETEGKRCCLKVT